MLKGLDLSHWNNVHNWSKLNSWDFIIYKCTEATHYVDATYANAIEEIKKLDVINGAYHFARGGDVEKEAKHFLDNVDTNLDLLVLDWEIAHPDTVAWCNKFCDIVKEKTGRTPIIYTNDARARVYTFKYDVWVARYGVNNGEPSYPPKFNNWLIWQYTSRGQVDGIYGNVDLNQAKNELNNYKKDMSDNCFGYEEKHIKNFERIARKVEKLTGEEYGEKPNDNETDAMLEELDKLIKGTDVNCDEIENKLAECKAINEKLEKTINGVRDLVN